MTNFKFVRFVVFVQRGTALVPVSIAQHCLTLQGTAQHSTAQSDTAIRTDRRTRPPASFLQFSSPICNYCQFMKCLHINAKKLPYNLTLIIRFNSIQFNSILLINLASQQPNGRQQQQHNVPKQQDAHINK